jgi:hypothetical protein
VEAEALRAELDPSRYFGRAPEQVREFLDGPVHELLEKLADIDTLDDARVTV